MKFIKSYPNRVKTYFKNLKIRIVRRYNRLSPRTKELIENLYSFLYFVIEYGILINVVLYGVFNIPVTIKSIFGWGVLWYFIKYELKSVHRIWRGE